MFAKELQVMRLEAGLSIAEAANLLGMKDDGIRKWEKGESTPRELAIEGLCNRYEAGEAQRKYLLWLYAQRDSPDIVSTHIHEPRPLFIAEQYYQRIYKHELLFVPGVLQIEDYHRAPEISDPRAGEGDLERVWDLRVRRQKALQARRGANIKIVMGEGVLLGLNRLPCATQQIEHMLKMVHRGWDLRVERLPYGLMYTGFDLFLPTGQSTPDMPPFTYYEVPDKFEYVESPQRLREYKSMFDHLMNTSVSLEEYLNAD
ncbi:Scr1 family TA system antitoxin-like transcriptional regulator [Salininema proteolyticum]|uniref:Scr1 family TA system antitoxin-like transcriptional regulator n=1 Tax=Salininema proteolyticum TaxID=1607685 RepID=A0ABV8U066_9ACTN